MTLIERLRDSEYAIAGEAVTEIERLQAEVAKLLARVDAITVSGNRLAATVTRLDVELKLLRAVAGAAKDVLRVDEHAQWNALANTLKAWETFG
jgi:hypothetical protein